MPIQGVNASIRWLARCLVAFPLAPWVLAGSVSAQTPSAQPPAWTASKSIALPLGTSAPGGTSSPSEVTVVTTDPNQLVLNALHQAVWGPPIACKVHQRSHAFGQQVIVSGEYKASGGGTGQFRYNARVSSGETTFDTIQVSDGRLMYTQVGTEEAPRRVIIDQVRQSLGNSIFQTKERPEVTFYLAIGGHSELLRSLYHRYRWYRAVEGKINGVEVWQLVGRIRTEAPKFAGTSQIDLLSIATPPPGSEVPTEVRLTLGRSSAYAYFPYMVEYIQRIKSKDGGPDGFEPVSILEHTEPTLSVNISEKDFVYKVQDSVDKIDDETSIYLPNLPK